MTIPVLRMEPRSGLSLLSFSLAGAILLSGCAQTFTPKITPAPGRAQSEGAGGSGVSSSASVVSSDSVSTGAISGDRITADRGNASAGDTDKLSQCTRELEALRSFDKAKYTRYQAEFARITRTSALYLGVASGISSDINDLVRPKYQYALTSLCYRIKNDLSTALINQVGSHD